MTSSYKFSHFEVMPALRQVLANGAHQALGAKAFDLLVCLLRQRSRVMSKDELLTQVWPGLVVAENNLSVQIVALRKLFGREAIVTVQGRGFRFGLDAQEVPAAGQPAPAETPNVAGSADTLGRNTPAIAVMPFASQTGDGHADQLAMAFAGELIAELARHKELRTISRFSAFSLKSQGLSSKAVCALLNARFLVSGQIQLSETQMDWSLEMVEGQSDEIVWQEQKTLAVSDSPAARSSLARHLSGAIHSHFLSFIARQSLMAAPEALNAYDLCTRAIANLSVPRMQGTREAIRLAALAVELHPHYALAWRVLAQSNTRDLVCCHTAAWSQSRVDQALEQVHKSIELDPTQAMAYGTLANLLSENGQQAQAQIAADQALALAPGEPGMLLYQAIINFYTGHLQQSKAASEAYLADMQNIPGMPSAVHGRTLLALGEHEAAVKILEDALSVSPGTTPARMALVVALEEMRLHDAAAQHFSLLMAHSTGFNEVYFGKRWGAVPELRTRFVAALKANGMASANA